jgi:hypothetical protein
MRLRALLADLLADRVFLVIQSLLFLLGDVAAILAGHDPFFLADVAILLVQRGGFGLAHIAFLNFLMDSFILVAKPVIDLIPTRMVLFPLGFGHGAGGNGRRKQGHHGNNGGLLGNSNLQHVYLP